MAGTPPKTRENLREKAYRIIKQKIVNCDLMPGTFIVEKDLLEEIGVSRTPIREAFNRLEREHLVEIHANRGITVTNITIKNIIDIYTARETVEPVVARLATPNIPLKELDVFYQVYAATDHPYTVDEHIELDRNFHRLIATSSQNQYLAHFLLNLYDQNTRIRTLSKIRVKERLEEARAEHFELVTCFLKRDEKRAEDVMRIHIANGRSTALKIV